MARTFLVYINININIFQINSTANLRPRPRSYDYNISLICTACTPVPTYHFNMFPPSSDSQRPAAETAQCQNLLLTQPPIPLRALLPLQVAETPIRAPAHSAYRCSMYIVETRVYKKRFLANYKVGGIQSTSVVSYTQGFLYTHEGLIARAG